MAAREIAFAEEGNNSNNNSDNDNSKVETVPRQLPKQVRTLNEQRMKETEHIFSQLILSIVQEPNLIFRVLLSL